MSRWEDGRLTGVRMWLVLDSELGVKGRQLAWGDDDALRRGILRYLHTLAHRAPKNETGKGRKRDTRSPLTR